MSKRILIVDDDRGVRDTLATLVKCKGYELVEAVNGEDALYELRHGDFDLVLLDVNMPRMDGYELMERLSPEILGETPVVLITGRDRDSHILQGYRSGATYYITKPFKYRTVANIVDYLLGDVSEERRQELEMML
jgi:two-component system chemotaxis response regulator CheY